MKIRYHTNKEEMQARGRAEYLRNKERVLKQKAEYYQKNKEEKKRKAREYRAKNKDKIASRRQSKEYKAKDVLQRQKRRARKYSTGDGTITIQATEELLTMQNNRCYYCSCELGDDKHLDHYFPLSKGGVHSINNVVWSCPPCNLKKSATSPLTLF